MLDTRVMVREMTAGVRAVRAFIVKGCLGFRRSGAGPWNLNVRGWWLGADNIQPAGYILQLLDKLKLKILHIHRIL